MLRNLRFNRYSNRYNSQNVRLTDVFHLVHGSDACWQVSQNEGKPRESAGSRVKATLVLAALTVLGLAEFPKIEAHRAPTSVVSEQWNVAWNETRRPAISSSARPLNDKAVRIRVSIPRCALVSAPFAALVGERRFNEREKCPGVRRFRFPRCVPRIANRSCAFLQPLWLCVIKLYPSRSAI